MRFWPYVLFVLLLGHLLPAYAQDAPPVRRLEGTLTQTVSGATAKAQLAFESPASLKINIERNDAALVPAQVIVATGDETRWYEPLTRRVHRLPYNIAREWYRGWGLQAGGPANFAFSNTPLPAKPATRWRRDAVLFGGSGDRAFYAATKSLAPLWPTIELGTTPTRLEKDEAGAVTAETLVQWNADKLPVNAATQADGVNHVFVYDLKSRAEAFPAGTFELPAEAAEAIVEEDELGPVSAYTAQDANAWWNRGAAHVVGTEDYAAAVDAWNRAGTLNTKATIPALSIFEAALTTRNLTLAAEALTVLAARNLDKAELEARKAQLALLKRDYAAALTNIDAARAAAPDNSDFALQRAEILRLRGDTANAQTALLDLLKGNAPLRAQLTAAQSLAEVASADFLAQIPTETEPQKLARSLLQLREGKTAEVTDFKDSVALAAYASGLERAGRDNDAQTVWTTLEGRAAVGGKNLARAHLMALAARRGDTVASLRAFQDWNATLHLEEERNNARLALFDAWQKAYRNDALFKALQNRSQAGGATSDDLRLWLGWQEFYGQPEDIRFIAENASGRFPNEAFWQSKLADVKVAEANEQPGNDVGLAKRERLFRDANAALDRAIKLAPQDPFYAMQRVLVAVQRARPRSGVIDAARNAINATAARTVFDSVEKDWPNDPDVALTIALAQLGLSGDAGAAPAQARATAALASPPGDGNRHTLITAARQALARVARRQKNPTAIRRQFQTLIDAAPTATEQGGLANSLLTDLEGATDGPDAALILTNLARQPWDYSESRLLLDGVSARAADIPDLAWPTWQVLQAQNDGAAVLAEVALADTLYQRAQSAINAPQAPPAADAEFDRATAARNNALLKLERVATAPDTMLAGRAAALLAENTSGAEALTWLRQAVTSEPSDPALRLTLMETLLATGSPDEARQERDAALRILELSPDTRRRLALFSLRLNDQALAWKLAQEAYNDAFVSPAVDANTFQRVAFATAHAAFVNQQIARGLEIYNGLASAQWNTIDRATALLALRAEYIAQGKADEAAKLKPRFAELGLTEDDYKTAQAFLDSLAS